MITKNTYGFSSGQNVAVMRGVSRSAKVYAVVSQGFVEFDVVMRSVLADDPQIWIESIGTLAEALQAADNWVAG